MPCAQTFVQGPEQYLNELGVTLPCAVHPERTAVLDAGHCVFVDYEAYYVSDSQALEEFLEAPYRYAGRVTDPVSHERFVAGETSPRRDRAGRIFYFQSDETASRFDADPDAYATPMISMRPEKAE